MSDKWDDYLNQTDKYGNASNLKDLRKQMPNQYSSNSNSQLLTPNPRSTGFTFPSNAPKGVNGLEVRGNIGDNRQNEAVKVFGAKAMGGKTPYRNPLVKSTWRSHGEIDSEFGPGDRIV